MAVSAHNTETHLLICAAYFSSNEIQGTVSYACNGKSGGVQALANPGLLMKVCTIITKHNLDIQYHYY